MFILELNGFQNFKRIQCKNIEEARKAFVDAKNTTYKVNSLDGWKMVGWTNWELFENGNLVKSGNF